MTGNKLLLDTNIIVEIFNGDKSFADNVHQVEPIHVPAIVLGELYVGVYRVTSPEKHLKKLQDFLTLCNVVNVDDDTAKLYGSISAKLLKKGKPIPTNDIWIAAIAIQHSFTLITGDKHFKEIEGLKIKTW